MEVKENKIVSVNFEEFQSKISIYSRYRATKTLESGRDPFQNEHPTYLTPEEEALLESIIKIDAACSECPSFEEICLWHSKLNKTEKNYSWFYSKFLQKDGRNSQFTTQQSYMHQNLLRQILQPQQLITSSTTLFCVVAEGFAFSSALPFPQTLDLSSTKDFNNKQFLIFQNLNGWMTKQIFRYLMLTIYIPAIVERRREFAGAERSLVMLDGHGSRLCIDVWKKCQENNIDVIGFLSHTTHMIQALDRGINVVYKQELQKHAIMTKAQRVRNVLLQ
ncbi:MAG: hypothetical protein EZS28_010832 [Streblomastix strix]|uniref:DDE-1 domain-containing protein n=1 Tax=Streblomastix strix TaxID=222440 RepID=A0A5J4WFZ4_9EUKA|nr:MAG: hypothetical protein EZS28_010832 [Streblomastix strix]